jgi:hypothetical protein
MEKKIYDKWVEKDENGSPVIPLDRCLPIEGSVSITDVASFTKEMEELMNFENENFDKMNFDDLDY